MPTIVITGSTRGIGLGLAKAFLDRGCAVVICGRTPAGIEAATAVLSAGQPLGSLLGEVCDVTEAAQVQALWDAAKARFGQVDIWVNNAGINTATREFWTHAPEEIAAVIQTNVVGAMYGARVALAGMLAQGHGAIYQMEGLGSNGQKIRGTTLYGTTKRALAYLTDALADEVRGTGVIVGALQPGMVATEMLTRQREERPDTWEQNRRIFNILGERVETVAPWLAQRVLENRRNGARIRYLTSGKVAWRFLTAPLRKRDIFEAV